MAIKELFNDSRPQVLFDPRASQRIDPRFKFTRDGVASYYDSQGILRYAPANQPRVGFNYEPDENGVMLPVQGLLLEAAGTNLVTYSEQFDHAVWSKLNITITANAAVSPDGTTTADKVVATNATGIHSLFPTSISANTYTFSVFAKQAEYSRLAINYYGISFNLDTGVIESTLPWQYNSSAKIEKFANGWYRCSVTGTASGNLYLSLSNAAPAGNLSSPPSFTGDGTSGIYLWGAQIEASSYPTSYIPTAGSTVTREPDLLTIEAPLPSTGSIYIDARSLTSDVDDTLLSAAPASPSTDKLALAIRQPANLFNSKALVYEVDGAFKPTLPFPVPSNAQERNLITYGANNYHYRSDSARYTPSSSSSVPANMTRLGIGHDVTDPTKAMSGYINAVYLWPGEITPTVAEALVRGDVDPKDADAGTFTPEAGALAFAFNTQGTSTDGDRVVQLPVSGSTNNILVDWGDNTSSSFIGAAASSTVSHTYSSAGIYPVQITADDDGTNSGLENLQFYGNSPADLVRVLQWGGTTTFQPTTMYLAFYGCTQMDFETAARTNLPDTSGVTNWQSAFYNCSSISGTFPTFNTSAATSFYGSWSGCSGLTSFPFIASSNVTDFRVAWDRCSGLTSFPLIDTSAGTDFGYAWSGCSNLTSFPLINTGAATNFSQAWNGCSGLTSFPAIDTSKGTNFSLAWSNCSSLTSFPLIDTSAGTNFGVAWSGCSSLTSFPLIDTSLATTFISTWYGCAALTSFPLLNTSNVTNFQQAWEGCSALTSFPLIDTSAGTTFISAWRGCNNLTSFPLINTSAGTNFGNAWRDCNSLTSFPAINTSSAANLVSAWYQCSSLTSFPALDTSICTNFYTTWLGCSSLTSFPAINTSQATNVSYAWYSCSSLTSFPALNFDNVVGSPSTSGGFELSWAYCTNLANFPAGLFNNTTCTRFINAFLGCALTAQSIENILVSIDTAGTSNGTLGLNGGTNTAKTSWTTAANTAYTNLIGKGWTIYYN